MSKKLARAIIRLQPEAQFVIRGDQIEWHSENIPQPTQEEIAAALLAIDGEAYKELRAAKYPSIADQLDVLYHGGYDAWRAAVQAVKDKYPKPGA
jgi:hypothetical protein